jgi:hypothetical protein
MNKLHLAIALSLAAGFAHAGETTQPAKTRAEVKAELARAQADGSMLVWSQFYNDYDGRAQVQRMAAAIATTAPTLMAKGK